MKIILTTITVILFSNFAIADCPVDSTDGAKIQEAIEATDLCYDAADIAKSCAWGSSIDVGFAGAAMQICETATPELSIMEQAVYDAMVEQCFKKFEGEQGTMYRSAAAFCALGVAETMNSVYSPVGY